MATAHSCQTCNLSFKSPQDWRVHAKDEWHVYRLQLKTAEPGTEPRAPSTPDPKGEFNSVEGETQSDSNQDDEDEDTSDYDSDDSDVEIVRDYDPKACLFCPTSSPSLDLSLEHMRLTHGLIIPHQEHLKVDVQTVCDYLHFVIAGYFECISCGRRKGSEEAAVQHMLAKSHCRVNLLGEAKHWYNEEVFKEAGFSAEDEQDAQRTLRNGRIIRSRRDAQPTNPRRRPLQPITRREAIDSGSSASASAEPGTELSKTQEKKVASMETALSKLSVNDRASLMHLPQSEQRAILATRQQQMEKAEREENRARGQVERLGNKTLMRHFVPDTPGRKNG